MKMPAALAGRGALSFAAKLISATTLIVAGATFLLGSPSASAWTSPANTEETYWIPGPPGSADTGCWVGSENGIAYGAGYGELYPLWGLGSECEPENSAQMYYDLNGSYGWGNYASDCQNTWCISWGPSGSSVVWVYYSACNIYYYCPNWEASWLG
jgi:hypothetical protein